MKDINLKDLQDIQIPEGLEERLSAKIDLWEQEERQEAAQPRAKVISVRWWRYVAVAASVVLVAGVAVLFVDKKDDGHIVAQAKVETSVTKSPDSASVASEEIVAPNEAAPVAPVAQSRHDDAPRGKTAVSTIEAEVTEEQAVPADTPYPNDDFRNHLAMQDAAQQEQMAEGRSQMAEFALLLQDAMDNCEASRAAMQSNLQAASLMQGTLYY